MKKSRMPIQNIAHHYEEGCSNDDDDFKKYIKVCVQEELQTLSKNKKATRIVPPTIDKQKKLITQDKICDCGKYIGKMSNQQVEMHMRSKFHNENI